MYIASWLPDSALNSLLHRLWQHNGNFWLQNRKMVKDGATLSTLYTFSGFHQFILVLVQTELR